MQRLVIALVMMIGFLPVAAQSHTMEFDNIQFIHPWVEPAEAGESVVINISIMNNNRGRARINRIEASIAQKTVMRQDGKKTDRIVIAPNDVVNSPSIEFELVNLKKKLEEGDTFLVTIHAGQFKEYDFQVVVGEDSEPQ